MDLGDDHDDDDGELSYVEVTSEDELEESQGDEPQEEVGEESMEDDETESTKERTKHGSARLGTSAVAGKRLPKKKFATYKEPSQKQPGGGSSGPRAQRLQRTYVVRNVPSFTPTEIYGASGAFLLPRKMSYKTPKNMKKYMNVLREYGGFDPASLYTPLMDDRVLNSSKAADESESEHYQRILATMLTSDKIKMNRVKTVQELADMSQRELNNTRQHERFTRAIDIKAFKAEQDALKDRTQAAAADFDLLQKRRDEEALGGLKRDYERHVLRGKISLAKEYPEYPLAADAYRLSLSDRPTRSEVDGRKDYINPRILSSGNDYYVTIN